MTAPVTPVRVNDLRVGACLPAKIVPLSLQRLVMEAGVNRDFAPIHHDNDAARLAGAPGAFTNFVFIQSLIEFSARSWFGETPRIARIAIKLGKFNPVGARLSCMGHVVELRAADESPFVRLALTIHADDTETTTGECDLVFPSSVNPIPTSHNEA